MTPAADHLCVACLTAAVLTHCSAALYALLLAAAWPVQSRPYWSNAGFRTQALRAVAIGVVQRAGSLLNTLVPHPLRPAECAGIAQTSRASWWRDWFFSLYQTNLPPAFGSGGLAALGVLAGIDGPSVFVSGAGSSRRR